LKILRFVVEMEHPLEKEKEIRYNKAVLKCGGENE